MALAKRVPEIDSLRGIAAIAVCLFHFSLYTNNSSWLPFSILRYGATGVDLFFMISGFVILLSMEVVKSQKEFWFARFKRIMPTYWLSILITLVIYYYLNSNVFRSFFLWNHLLGNILMMQPLFHSGELVGVYWTLYVELCFYVMISIVWKLGLKQYLEKLLWCAWVVMCLVNLLYLYFHASFGLFIPLSAEFPLVTSFAFFGVGIVFYRIYVAGWKIEKVLLLLAYFLMIGITQFTGGHFNSYLSLPGHLVCNLVFGLLFLLIISKKAGFLNKRWLVYLGTVSYALYLVHDSVGRYALLYLVKTLSIDSAILIALILSIFTAVIITFGYEKPVQRWLAKRRS